MHRGYIKFYRRFLDWEWYQDSNCVRLFIHLLLKSNFKDNKWQGIEVKRGQIITSINHLSKETGLSEQQVRSTIKKLISTSEITSKATNKFTIITIEKYSLYQSQEEEITNNLTSNTTNDQQTNNKQITNNQQQLKNVNNVKNENNEKELKENIYTEHFNLMLTKSEYEKIIAEYPKDIVDETIDAIKNTSKEVSKKYLSFNLLLRNWIKRNYKLNKTENKSNEVVKDDMDTSKIAEELRRRGL